MLFVISLISIASSRGYIIHVLSNSWIKIMYYYRLQNYKIVHIHSTSTVTSSVSIPCWLSPLVGLMVLTAVHLYVPAWRRWMLGIVRIDPVRLKDLSLILVHSYRIGMGLDTTLHVIFIVSPANILLSGIICTEGGSVCLEIIQIENDIINYRHILME